jgi:hypothetical protein
MSKPTRPRPVWDCFPTVGMQAANSLTIVTLPFSPLAMQPCLVITPSAYVGASKLSPYEVAVATLLFGECTTYSLSSQYHRGI